MNELSKHMLFPKDIHTYFFALRIFCLYAVLALRTFKDCPERFQEVHGRFRIGVQPRSKTEYGS